MRTWKPFVWVDWPRQEWPETDVDDTNPVARMKEDRLNASNRVVVKTLGKKTDDWADVRSAQDVAGRVDRVRRVLVDEIERDCSQQPIGGRLRQEKQMQSRFECGRNERV